MVDEHTRHPTASSAVETSETSHQPEDPGVWGQHADFGKAARIGGWATVIALLLMVSATHYNDAGAFALIATAAGLIIGLLWDMRARRLQWRK